MTLRQKRKKNKAIINSIDLNKWRALIKKYIQITNIGYPQYVIRTVSSDPELSKLVAKINWVNDTTVSFINGSQNIIKSIDPKFIIQMKLLTK